MSKSRSKRSIKAEPVFAETESAAEKGALTSRYIDVLRDIHARIAAQLGDRATPFTDLGDDVFACPSPTEDSTTS